MKTTPKTPVVSVVSRGCLSLTMTRPVSCQCALYPPKGGIYSDTDNGLTTPTPKKALSLSLTTDNLRPFRGPLGRKGWHRSTAPGVCLSLLIEPSRLWLASIFVRPEARGRGLGTQAMVAVLAEAERRQLPVVLYAKADHPRHQRRLEHWYIRLGFSMSQSGVMTYEPKGKGHLQ